MLIESLMASIVVGIIRGGKLSRFAQMSFKRVWIFVLALIVQLSIIFFGVNGNEFVLRYVNELHIASFILLFIGLILNINFRELWLIIIGSIMNLVVAFANGGKLPISMEALKLTGFEELSSLVESGQLALYTPITEATKYSILGDFITVPAPYPFPHILSLGDIVIALGLFLFIQQIVLNEGYDKSKMVTFKYKSRI